jgi:hypothetical protein
MADGYSRSPRLLKGALIQFSAPLLIPIPNIILFQYNPETMSRSFTPWEPPTKDEFGNIDPKIAATLAQPYDPQESINLALELDAADALEEPLLHPIAVVSGVADRIAAMEMLLYPLGQSTLGGLRTGSLKVSARGFDLSEVATRGIFAERMRVPIVLFFWGPGRVVPVRIKTFSVDEQAYSPTLYPLRAKVTIGLTILDAATFYDDDSAVTKLARACYNLMRAQKEGLALANVLNSVESIIGVGKGVANSVASIMGSLPI